MSEAPRFILDPSRAVLVVIDVQEKLSAAMPKSVLRQVVKNTGVLIAAAGELGFSILLTEQYPQGLGRTLPELQQQLGSVKPIEKLAFSCCGEAAFTSRFSATDPRQVILTGMEAHVCVYQTALDLLGAGHHVFVPVDAVCSRSKANWRIGIEAMRRAGAVIGSTEMFLFQMLKVAGSESFKKLAKLVQ